jgi:hypothetical protein
MRTAIAAFLVGLIVFVFGGLAEFGDTYSRTAFVLGVACTAFAFLVVGEVMER